MIEIFIGLIGFAVIMVLYMWKEAYHNQVVEHTLVYDSFNSSTKFNIFFISDIHRRLVHKDIINQVKGKADIVIIGGDLTERGVPFSRTVENLTRLKDIGPMYFVWGNNDYEVNISHFRNLLLESGVKILENTHDIIPVDANYDIYLAGINEISFELDNLSAALEKSNEVIFKIVVCHNPEIIDQIHEQHQVSLILSGHTHGGQINLFGLGLFPKGRLYHREKGDLLISNGYGTTNLPLRFWARAETHLLTIKRK